MSQEPNSSSKKRPSSSSYTQSYKDGEVPKAHSAASEKVLAGHGVYINELQGLSYVQEESKSYCKRLLQSTYPEPQYTAFPLSKFLSVWQRVQNQLEHVVEDIDTEWTRCKTLGGPRLKPDPALGIAASAFNEEELAKLRNYTAFERATLFTNNLYFPFLLSEAKSADVGISVADRQNMHSSSMAVNAIVQLCRAADEAQVVDLSGRILVFSVSHDNERVKLQEEDHDFVREVYHTFYPAQLKRVRDALAAMEDPRNVSMTSSVGMEEDGSQELDPSARSSRETAGFKRPDTPASKKQKGEMALLREQLEQQRKDTEEREANLLRELEKQRQNVGKQRQESEQQQKELMKLLTEQSTQIKELLQKR
ncbi:hypothetical protein LTS08_006602 [Lithohypha guttulata]|uniref:DUF7924 domain-containing protein n=1 Tax=Lithohypha guttulata TaxID=1690604 RepID=A0ABR0K1N3_9EURO|nr:hypothetical protein LTR24_008228 [Lithohypha guttulata]KAK5097847.1 hypothetical protein LTS08_006602 [Lithohypha guttulata]KAK5313830.1 hypothetical protein LTR70_007404 [Exophiala xenobiotica]